MTAIRHRIPGIDRQVEQHLFDLAGISDNLADP